MSGETWERRKLLLLRRYSGPERLLLLDDCGVEVGFVELLFGKFSRYGKLLGFGLRGEFIHRVNHDCLDYGAESACSELEFYRLVDNKFKSFGFKLKLYAIHLKQLLILSGDGVFGLGENFEQGIAVEGLKIGEYGETADDFGNQTEAFEVLGSDKFEQVVALHLAALGIVAVAHHMGVEALGNLSLDAVKSTTAYEEYVFGVDSYHALLGMLAAALRGNVNNRAFEKFEQALLHTFAADVAGDGGVVALAGYLVDLVDKHDALFSLLYVIVGSLEQTCEQTLYIFAHIAGLGEHCGVDNCERHVEHLGYSAGNEGFTGAGRTYKNDVALLDVDVVVVLSQTFVVVVDGNRKIFLGIILTNDILVDKIGDFLGFGNRLAIKFAFGLFGFAFRFVIIFHRNGVGNPELIKSILGLVDAIAANDHSGQASGRHDSVFIRI